MKDIGEEIPNHESPWDQNQQNKSLELGLARSGTRVACAPEGQRVGRAARVGPCRQGMEGREALRIKDEIRGPRKGVAVRPWLRQTRGHGKGRIARRAENGAATKETRGWRHCDREQRADPGKKRAQWVGGRLFCCVGRQCPDQGSVLPGQHPSGSSSRPAR